MKNDGSIDAFASGGIPPYTYQWNSNPIQTTASATGLKRGVYTVVVTDNNNCITAWEGTVEQQFCCQLFIPNVFSPNNDDKNDRFRILERGGGVQVGEMKIYNRFGLELFSTQDLDKGWDGYYKGKLQDIDTYYYIITYNCNDKGVISQKIAKGDIILIL